MVFYVSMTEDLFPNFLQFPYFPGFNVTDNNLQDQSNLWKLKKIITPKFKFAGHVLPM